MSDTENRADAPAPSGEPIASAPIQSDAGAAPAAPAAQPAPTRIAESSFEAAHADLPPLSTLGGEAPSASVDSASAAPSGARRGRGRGPSAGKFGSADQPAKVAFGAVENPADMTESLSGKHVMGYGDQQPQGERPRREPREERKPRETAPEATGEVAPETTASAENGPKEFVPPVSEGSFKAELNPEAERKAREERRQQRDERPRGDRRNSEGGEFRGNREQAEGRSGGGDRQHGDRAPRGDRPQGERRDGNREGQQQRRDGHRNEQRPRPGRLTIEAPKIPVQEPTTFIGKLVRAFMNKVWGVPASEKVPFENVARPMTPHSKEWQFGRGQQRHDGRSGDNRNGGQRRDFRHGNGNQGGDRNPNRDGRHRPHARGGNHHQGGGNRKG